MSNKKKPLKFTLKAGLREWIGITLTAIIFFVLPIYGYTSITQPQRSDETYTEAALNQDSGGSVLGINTQNLLIENRYFKIPFTNYLFDTTLSDTSSVLILFGTIIMVGAIITTLVMFIQSSKAIVISEKYRD